MNKEKYIYVISKELIFPKYYKVGYYSGSRMKFIKICMKISQTTRIHFFEPAKNAKYVIYYFGMFYKQYRKRTFFGGLTKWYNLPLRHIIMKLNPLIKRS